jgi:hypothetical protein
VLAPLLNGRLNRPFTDPHHHHPVICAQQPKVARGAFSIAQPQAYLSSLGVHHATKLEMLKGRLSVTCRVLRCCDASMPYRCKIRSRAPCHHTAILSSQFQPSTALNSQPNNLCVAACWQHSMVRSPWPIHQPSRVQHLING